jgi:hypothetical protein
MTDRDQGEVGRMDLLTVVMHELGRVPGYVDGGVGIMAETLSTGQRLAPASPSAIETPASGTDGRAVAGDTADASSTARIDVAIADVDVYWLSDEADPGAGGANLSDAGLEGRNRRGGC